MRVLLKYWPLAAGALLILAAICFASSYLNPSDMDPHYQIDISAILVGSAVVLSIASLVARYLATRRQPASEGPRFVRADQSFHRTAQADVSMSSDHWWRRRCKRREEFSC